MIVRPGVAIEFPNLVLYKEGWQKIRIVVRYHHGEEYYIDSRDIFVKSGRYTEEEIEEGKLALAQPSLPFPLCTTIVPENKLTFTAAPTDRDFMRRKNMFNYSHGGT